MFHYPIDLHYSQTEAIRNYNAKQVSLPYRFTLLSNDQVGKNMALGVSLPYRFTLLSNCFLLFQFCPLFHYPIDLHYSQTVGMVSVSKSLFHYPIDLHYSQTSNLRKRPAIAVKSIGSIQNSQKSQSTIKRFSCSNLSKS